MRYHESYIWCMDTVAILKNDIFSLLGHFLRVILSLIFFSYIIFHEIRLFNLIYHTWSHNHIWVSRWRFGIIFGTQMTVILDLVNKSLTNVAEMYLIGFVDLMFSYQKYISSWSRKKDIIKIRFDVWTRRPFWKMQFFQCLDTFWDGYPV